MSVSLAIVGGRFRPPAIAIMNSLSVGTPLHIIPEPENEYDEHALAVYIYPKEVHEDDLPVLEERLPTGGSNLEEFMERESWHLGYVPKVKNQALRALMDKAKLQFTFCPEASGYPAMLVTEVEEGE